MGNPHAVLFLEDFDGLDIANLGPKLENHPMFPEKANISFAKINSKSQIKMRTWERGAGITMACGTGACAVVVAANKLLKIDKKIQILAKRAFQLHVFYESLENDNTYSKCNCVND